ncbi:MAG TPA: phage holin family protein [Solirubrobacteraceae bacterium]|nr:phage holin family protein [Solirubrobacteraceae bacterium]
MATDGPDNIATTISEVADRTTVIVREEIELAKAEVRTKLSTLGRGAGVAVAAGIFLSLAGVFFLHMLAWGLYVWLDVDVWVGYAIVVGLLLILGVISGLLAYRWLKGGSPPTPQMAIEEAQRVRATVTGEPLDQATQPSQEGKR